MNIAQRIVLVLGLIVIATIFYAPYRATKYQIKYESYYYEKHILRKHLLYEWVEFHVTFTPPLSENREGYYTQREGYEYNEGYKFITYKQRDYILQLSIISGEVVGIILLFFIFKTKNKRNNIDKQNK